MKNLISSVRASAENISNISVISVCGMLLAMQAVLGSFTINVTQQMKIGFAFLPTAVAGFLFGPVVGGIMGALGDVLSSIIRPTGPYFPGFTLSGFIGGFIYGLLLYKKPAGLLRTSVARAAVFVCVSLLLNPMWLCVVYSKSFIAVFAGRFAAKVIMLPADIFFLYTLLKIFEKGAAGAFGSRFFRRHGN